MAVAQSTKECLEVFGLFETFSERLAPTGVVCSEFPGKELFKRAINGGGSFQMVYDPNFRGTGCPVLGLGSKPLSQRQVEAVAGSHGDQISGVVKKKKEDGSLVIAPVYAPRAACPFPGYVLRISAEGPIRIVGNGMIIPDSTDPYKGYPKFELQSGEAKFGDRVVYAGDPQMQGFIVQGPRIDNGAGVASVFLAMSNILKQGLSEEDLEKILFVFPDEEEGRPWGGNPGFARGARKLSRVLPPTATIIIVDGHEPAELGEGAVIGFAAGDGDGMVTPPRLYAWLRDQIVPVLEQNPDCKIRENEERFSRSDDVGWECQRNILHVGYPVRHAHFGEKPEDVPSADLRDIVANAALVSHILRQLVTNPPSCL